MEALPRKKKEVKKSGLLPVLLLFLSFNFLGLIGWICFAFITGVLTVDKVMTIIEIVQEEQKIVPMTLTEEEVALRVRQSKQNQSIEDAERLAVEQLVLLRTDTSKMEMIIKELEKNKTVLDNKKADFETEKQAWKDKKDSQEKARTSKEFQELITTFGSMEPQLAYQYLNFFKPKSGNDPKVYTYEVEEVKNILLYLEADFRAELMSFYLADGQDSDAKLRGAKILKSLGK